MSAFNVKAKETMNNIMNNMSQVSCSVFILFLIIIIIAVSMYEFYVFRNLNVKETKIMDEIYGTLNGKISSFDPNLANYGYTFKDYYIKSAYNCCSGGNYRNDYVSIDILKDVIKQGIRGLDFEIFSIDNQPVIATSTSDNFYVKETFNYLPFASALSVICDNAFVISTAPNPTDPIIIHLRIKSTNLEMYKSFANILKNKNTFLLGEEYSFENHGKNLGNVKLSEFKNKIVIIVDRSNNAFLESQEFYEYVNMTSNSIFMQALHYYDIQYTPDINSLIDSNKQGMTIAMPDKGSDPDNPSGTVLRETGCQLLAMRWQKIDSNLASVEEFFNYNGSAFVLKPDNLRYIPVEIAAPPPQNPAVSYATKTIQSDFYKFDI